jgi:hypothetical protein
MENIAHPEVLARDWLPPVVLGREGEVADVVRRLDPPCPRAPPPWIVGVAGPAGSGTSTVARRAGREVADRIRATAPGRTPRWIAVRTAGLRGTHGVATALLASLDDGFDGRGFPVVEIVAGFLRRLRREGRPVVLVLDDLVAGGPDLAGILRPLARPDRFLPEGESGLPPVWTVLAGTRDSLFRTDARRDAPCPIRPFVELGAYAPRTLRRILEDRAGRALGRPAAPELVDRLLERALVDGGGATRLLDLFRRSVLGPTYRSARLGSRIPGAESSVPLETSVLRALEEATRGNAAVVGEVKRCEARWARSLGIAPLPATTLWRRILRLEQAGYVRREVRPGGVGGTRSVVRLMTPVDEWVTTPSPRGTRPASGTWGGLPDAPAPPGGSFPSVGLARPDDAPD